MRQQKSCGRPRGPRGRLASFVMLVLAAAGCVYPNPPAGSPIPTIVFSLSQPTPVSGVVSVTATPLNFTPEAITFWLDSVVTPAIVDDTAPFTVDVDTSHLPFGSRRVIAAGSDATYKVLELIDIPVQTTKPNVVVVLVDDLDATTTPFWSAMPKARARLADAGLSLTRAFAPNPLCCPARASILTGRYSHNIDVWDNSPPDGGFEAFRPHENDTVAVRLQGLGYDTAMIGKYLNGYEADPTHVPPGWDDWFALAGTMYDGYTYDVNHNGTVVSYGSSASDYQTDVLAQRAVDYVNDQETEDEKPFFLLLAPTAPHAPIGPAPRHADHQFSGSALPRLPNFNEADVSDKPTWLRSGVKKQTTDGIFSLTADHRNRMGSLLAVDDMVETLFLALQRAGELDDTVVMFTSDNGYNLGAHRLGAKMAPYEEASRVPMVVVGPSVRVGSEPALASLIDIAPSVINLAGGDASDLDGRSLVSVLQRPPAAWRGDLLIEYRGTWSTPDCVSPDPGVCLGTFDTFDDVTAAIAEGHPVSVPSYRAVRSTKHLYVEWYNGDVHEYELYDIAADPYQLVNLLATPEGQSQHASTVAVLQQRLDALASCTGSGCRN